jgi:hypothetical protein
LEKSHVNYIETAYIGGKYYDRYSFRCNNYLTSQNTIVFNMLGGETNSVIASATSPQYTSKSLVDILPNNSGITGSICYNPSESFSEYIKYLISIYEPYSENAFGYFRVPHPQDEPVVIGSPTPQVRVSALNHVDTIVVYSSGEVLGTDCSDNNGTLETINSKALSFGPLAPGQLSSTLIIYLKVPTSIAIQNIRLALVDCGGLSFEDTNFGVETRPYLDYNIVPSTNFSGVNEARDVNSIYNISVNNKDFQTSDYVYLNVSIPRDQLFGTGTIRYKWFFDYA